MNRFIRDVKINENAILTKIAFSAKGFYEKMGAKQIRLSKSSIPDRDIPVFQYKLNG